MLDAALELWERGFHTIPLGDASTPPPPSLVKRCGGDVEDARAKWPKSPRIQWADYQRRQPSEDEIRRWWQQWPQANIGIVTGLQVVVVDADSDEAVAYVQSGALTRTPWMVRTGRGVQFYYQANEKFPIRNSANAAAKLDIRGVGGYVVAPPSIHPNGRTYEWEVNEAYGADSVMDLPVLTADDIAAINGYNQPQGTGLDVDLSRVSLPASGAPVQPGGRNAAAASLAGRYIRDGMSLAEIEAELARWNAGNPVPLPAGELRTTIASVARTAVRNHPGEPIALTPAPRPEPSSWLYSYGDLLDSPPAQPESFWRGATLFRGARMLIAGGPKLGKSMLFQAMAIAAATGGNFLGWPFARPLRVAWLQAEIHKAFLPARFSRLVRGLEAAELDLLKANLTVSGRIDFDLTSRLDEAALTAALAERRPDIICFDPIINFSTADENDNVEIKKLLRSLDRLSAELDCAVAIVHHTNKGDPKGDLFSAIRGASAFRGWYDTGIVLSGSRPTMMAYELRNDETIPAHGLEFDADAGRYVATLVAGETGEVAGDEDEKIDPKMQGYVATALSLLKAEQLMTGQFKARLQKILQVSERTAERVLSSLLNVPGVVTAKDGKHTVYRYDAL